MHFIIPQKEYLVLNKYMLFNASSINFISFLSIISASTRIIENTGDFLIIIEMPWKQLSVIFDRN